MPNKLTAQTAGGTNLQDRIDLLKQLPFEPDVDKRPLAQSERAANRRDWVLRTLMKGYATSGHTNGGWNGEAGQALEAYADYSRRLERGRFAGLTNAVVAAHSAGCNDPMLEYLRVRYCQGDFNSTDDRYAHSLVGVFQSMLGSQYHPVFKFTAGLRAIEAARQADLKGARSALMVRINGALEDLARDTNAPAAEVFDGAFPWLDYSRQKGWADFVMHHLDGLIEKGWGESADLLRLRGLAEIRRAWEERGGGFADAVKEPGWQGFGEHLQKAEDFLARSWEMNSTNAYTAYLLMQVELGEGKGRPVMEKWFSRAMALSSDDYDAVQLMSFYLEPRWYGSEQAALAFARACVANTNWGGNVPLVLQQVHHSLARYYKRAEDPQYWQRPEVWDDIRSSYGRFFELNPQEVGWRHNFAMDAYLCGKYTEFLEQTKLFSGSTNFSFFGGQEKFQAMLAKAGRGNVESLKR